MDLGLKGKTAIITGGSRGLGYACSLAMGREGVEVVICGRDQGTIDKALAVFKQENIKATGVRADMVQREAAQQVYDHAIRTFGKVDVLINNVGGGRGSTFLDTTIEQWYETFELNLFGSIRLTKLAVPQMIERRWGRIICIGSIYGREYGGGMTYMASKAAIMGFTKHLSRQVAQYNVLVNTVAPGSIAHPGGNWQRRLEQEPEAMKEFIREEMPLGRFGKAEELAAVVTFMVSDKASYLTGAAWNVDGGQSRSLI